MSFDTLVDRQGRPLSQIWPAVKQFQELQDILDRNRVLIAEINHNHQLGTHTALERNVPMLRELNGNVAKAVQMYKEAADSFVVGVIGQEGGDAGVGVPTQMPSQPHSQLLQQQQQQQIQNTQQAGNGTFQQAPTQAALRQASPLQQMQHPQLATGSDPVAVYAQREHRNQPAGAVLTQDNMGPPHTAQRSSEPMQH